MTNSLCAWVTIFFFLQYLETVKPIVVCYFASVNKKKIKMKAKFVEIRRYKWLGRKTAHDHVDNSPWFEIMQKTKTGVVEGLNMA